MESWVRVLALLIFFLPILVDCRIRHYNLNVLMNNATRLCETKSIVTINEKFPGPTMYAREDDTLLIEVVNYVKYNAWNPPARKWMADGPDYISQCPKQSGQMYVYKYTLTGQRGIFWWHAHILWLRVTVHGGIVILPKRGAPYPFPKPNKEVVVILGEFHIMFVITFHAKNLREKSYKTQRVQLFCNRCYKHTIATNHTNKYLRECEFLFARL